VNFKEQLINNQKSLINNGFIKFHSLLKQEINLRSHYNNITNEFTTNSYSTGIKSSNQLLKELNIDEEFKNILYRIAKFEYGYEGNPNSSYIVTRLVRSGDLSESYRGHFDSHLFTLVIPVNIPICDENTSSGGLVFFPKIRNQPKSEYKNIILKIFYKLFSTKTTFKLLTFFAKKIENDFSDYCPLLFIGNTTYHLNRELLGSEHRVTILCHFFDPSPSVSISKFIRKFRNR